MIFAALNEAAENGELLLTDGGLCRFHLRRDGVVVIREIVVLPRSRRQGIGKYLIGKIAQNHWGRTLLAKCPVSYPSNRFWEAIGFVLVGTNGKSNEWQRSYSAPTGTRSLPVLR